MPNLTEAQRRVLVALFYLSERKPWVHWERIADRLGYEGRGRAAVTASLNRLATLNPPLILTATSLDGDVVALNADGLDTAHALLPEFLRRVEVRLDDQERVDELVMHTGELHIEMLSPTTAHLSGPGGLELAIHARAPLFARLRIEVLDPGEAEVTGPEQRVRDAGVDFAALMAEARFQ